jgi:hypothetical protein
MIAPLLAAVAASVPTVNLNQLFADTLPAVKAKTSLPILFPDTMPYESTGQIYTAGGGSKKEYSLSLYDAPDCSGANVCFIAEITGTKGGQPFGRGKATLAHGIHGRYQPLSCGASCSQPSISWKEHGVTYEIQADVEAAKNDRAALVKMADNAITRGAR